VFPGYPLVFEEPTVSGPGAQVSIVEALHQVAARPGVEVVILARGGGDAPSLLPWSSEEVCRAVAACPVPVASAIGHESDRPLCDEVADLRCGTPSLAAAAVVPNRAALEERLRTRIETARAAASSAIASGSQRLARADPRGAAQVALARCGHRLALARAALVAENPRRLLASCRARLAAADWRRPAFELLGRAGGRLEADVRHLRALSPARTLERGYAIVTGPDGSIVRVASALSVGDAIRVKLSRGGLTATVTEVSR
jgi:exodeoxyribonuclease VII large subunit